MEDTDGCAKLSGKFGISSEEEITVIFFLACCFPLSPAVATGKIFGKGRAEVPMRLPLVRRRMTFLLTPTAFEIRTGFSVTWTGDGSLEEVKEEEVVVSEVVVLEVW